MPNSNYVPAEFEEHIRARLRELTATYPQAEIARKAGISKANVHRYLKRNRIPASLCAAIAEHLGVSATWLLCGRGTPLGAGAATGPAQAPTPQATGLLELVESMNHAARLNLGALSGKQHLKAARQLSDALQRYEETRRKLSAGVAGVLRRVLEDWKAAYQRMHVEQCATLRESASQLMRLCDDHDLRIQFEATEAFHESAFGDEDKALPHHFRVVALSLFRSEGIDPQSVSRIATLVGMLDSQGRVQEGLNIGRAGLEFARGMPAPQQTQLNLCVGALMVEQGHLRKGLEQLRKAMANAPAGSRGRRFATVYWSLAQFWAGVMEFDDVRKTGVASWERGEYLMCMGLWLEDPRAMRIALGEYEAERSRTSGRGSTESITVRWGLQGLQKPAARIVAAATRELLLRQPPETALPIDRFTVEVYQAQVAWLCGRHTQAAQLVEAAARSFDNLPAGHGPVLLARSLYWRLVLRLVAYGQPQARVRAARRYFATLVKRGYARFVPVQEAT